MLGKADHFLGPQPVVVHLFPFFSWCAYCPDVYAKVQLPFSYGGDAYTPVHAAPKPNCGLHYELKSKTHI